MVVLWLSKNESSTCPRHLGSGGQKKEETAQHPGREDFWSLQNSSRIHTRKAVTGRSSCSGKQEKQFSIVFVGFSEGQDLHRLKIQNVSLE